MQLSKSLLFTSSVFSAGLAAAQDWGSFSGQVATIEHLIANDYSLTSDLTIALNSSWSLVDIVGRREGQIANKSIIFNTADKKYYAKIAYINTATNQTDTLLCFPAVPIRISLNQESDDGAQLRLIDGSFDIGCIEKTRVEGVATTTENPGTTGTSSFSKSIKTSTSIITKSESTTLSTLLTPVSTTSEEPSSSTVFELSTFTLSETPMSTVTFAPYPTSEETISASGSASVTISSKTNVFVIETISSGSSEPTSTFSSSVFEIQTSSFVTFTSGSASASASSASTVTPNVSASATSGNGSFNGVDQSNTATKMASIESTFYMGAFMALFLAATLA
jgi:hypothetical protein